MATKSIGVIQRAVAAQGLPVTTSGPVIVKRPISGKSTPSQHSFGNAMDYYPSSGAERAQARKGVRSPALESLYSFLTRGMLPVATVCYYRRGGCTTDHLDHLHVSGSPKVRSTGNIFDRNPELIGGIGMIAGRADPDSLTARVSTPLETTGGVLSSVGEFLGVLASGELWVRVGFIVGGFAAAGAGVYFVAKEFGAPSFADVAGVAKTVATKGAA